jgi:type I restriction enzyme R subunit
VQRVVAAENRGGAAEVPYLIPIGERAEAIAEAFQKRQNTTQEALQELYKIAEEYEKAEDRKGR